ncbi:hypothetical protein [Streptomyces sp. NPDC058621]
MSIVYDRTKILVRRHVTPGEAVPLHPGAVRFARPFDIGINVLAAYRPSGKGREERQVPIVRDHVQVGRAFSSIEGLALVPSHRAKTYGRLVAFDTNLYSVPDREVPDHPPCHPPTRRPSGRPTSGPSAAEACVVDEGRTN